MGSVRPSGPDAPYTRRVLSARTVLDRLSSRWRLLLKELSAFGTVGGVCFLVDIGLFQLLYAHLGVGAVTAKVVSTVVATTLAYLGHRHWSFSHRPRRSTSRQYVLFALVNGGTLVMGAGIVALVRYPLGQDDVLIIQIANIASIVLSTAVRYLAYRQWVFPAQRAAGDPPAAEDEADARIVA